MALTVEESYSGNKEITRTADEWERIIFEAAGAATAPLLADNPYYVFPSERVLAAVNRVLEKFDLEELKAPEKLPVWKEIGTAIDFTYESSDLWP